VTIFRVSGEGPNSGVNSPWAVINSRLSTNILLYLGNDAREDRSYCGTSIWTRVRSIEWCHFQWPWMTLNLEFKSDSYNGMLVGIYTCPIQQRNFEWSWVILTDFPKFPTTWSVARAFLRQLSFVLTSRSSKRAEKNCNCLTGCPTARPVMLVRVS